VKHFPLRYRCFWLGRVCFLESEGIFWKEKKGLFALSRKKLKLLFFCVFFFSFSAFTWEKEGKGGKGGHGDRAF